MNAGNGCLDGVGRRAGWLLLLAAALAAVQLDAAVKTWSGAGADNNWATAANWGGVAPVDNADDLVFAGSARLNTTNNLTTDWRFKTLTFATNASAFVLNGNSIKAGLVNLTFANNSRNTQTVNLNINSLAKPSIWTNDTGDFIMNGTLTSSLKAATFNANAPSTLTKDGLGTLTLNGNCTFTSVDPPGLKILNGTVALDLDAGGSLSSSTILEYGLGTSNSGDINKQGGTLIVRGQSTGTSLQSFAGLNFYDGTSIARILVDPNGGGGTTLAFGSYWDRRSCNSFFHVDLSRAGAAVTLRAPLSASRIIGSWCTVTDGTKTGFATTNAAGQLVRNTTLYDYPWLASTTTTNYFTSGIKTLSGIGRPGTLTIQGGGSVSGGSWFYAAGMLMEEGVGDYTFSVPSVGFTSATHLHQHSLAGSIIFNCKLQGTFYKAGPGKVVVRKNTENPNVVMHVREGTVELRAALSGAGHHVFNGGTLSGYGTVSSNLTVYPGGCLEGTHATNNAIAINGHLVLKDQSIVSMALADSAFNPLQVAGTVTNLGARLALTLNYRPQADETITLLTCNRPISGTFKTVNGAPLGKGDTFVLNYNAEPCKFSLVSRANSVVARFISRPGTLVLVR
jgi:hypothetical protein